MKPVLGRTETGLLMNAILVVIGYVVGAIPFALLLARQVGGTDVRAVGSGNVGAANVLRTTGAFAGLMVMALDISKGCAVVLFAGSMGSDSAVRAVVGAAAVVGHVFPVWLRFRGGKGVATACGVFAVLAPRATAVAVATFGLVVWITRYVSLGSILGGTCAAAARLSH